MSRESFLPLFQAECNDWVRTAKIMVCELTGEEYVEPAVPEIPLTIGSESAPPGSVSDGVSVSILIFSSDVGAWLFSTWLFGTGIYIH